MKIILSNKKNILEKLTEVFGGGSLISLGLKINCEWIAEYASADDVVKNGNMRLPIHNCFKPSPSFYFSSS